MYGRTRDEASAVTLCPPPLSVSGTARHRASQSLKHGRVHGTLPVAGGNGALADVANARQQLTQAATQAPAGAALAPGVDYIIGAEYSPAADQLWVVAGNNG